MTLKSIWNAPSHLRLTYKVNRIAVEKVNKVGTNSLQLKKEEEHESELQNCLIFRLLRRSTTNRFADLSDDDQDSVNSDKSD